MKVSIVRAGTEETYAYDEASDDVVRTTYDGQQGLATSIINASELKSRGYTAASTQYNRVDREQLKYYFY